MGVRTFRDLNKEENAKQNLFPLEFGHVTSILGASLHYPTLGMHSLVRAQEVICLPPLFSPPLFALTQVF